jgi:hypothetical protein
VPYLDFSTKRKLYGLLLGFIVVGTGKLDLTYDVPGLIELKGAVMGMTRIPRKNGIWAGG